ncbi:MAG: LysM peptidoglycan-binding domain-containing protein [Candidatus Hydrogenedentota bacterium]
MMDFRDRNFQSKAIKPPKDYTKHKRIIILAIILFTIPFFGFFSGNDCDLPTALNNGRKVINAIELKNVKNETNEETDVIVPEISLEGYTLINYVLLKGDNFSSLSKRTGIHINLIRQANKELNTRKIKSGTIIKLPVKSNVLWIKVLRGDSLYSLAKSFRVPVNKIIKRNRLKSETIYPGTKLIIDI